MFGILVNWVGTREKLTELVHRLPCGITAKNMYMDAVKLDCHQRSLEPRDSHVCGECGQQFEYYRYLFAECSRYQHHLAAHQKTCKVCGAEFDNKMARVYHQRTHNEGHIKCGRGVSFIKKYFFGDA